jgi:phosphomannomutase
MVTASHNPIEWNGLKFVREDGIFLYPKECEELFSFVDDHLKKEPSQANGMYWKDKNSIQKHIIHTVSLNCININRIRRRKFKVVIDAVNGAGSVALPAMLEALGCDVVPLNCEPSGEFTRGTEPLPENLTDLCQSVIANSADVGFAVDPDADRLAVVSEKGVPLGEEYTLVLAAEGYMKKMGTSETFVVNLSTLHLYFSAVFSNAMLVERFTTNVSDVPIFFIYPSAANTNVYSSPNGTPFSETTARRSASGSTAKPTSALLAITD